jgi:hypothetical protein
LATPQTSLSVIQMAWHRDDFILDSNRADEVTVLHMSKAKEIRGRQCKDAAQRDHEAKRVSLPLMDSPLFRGQPATSQLARLPAHLSSGEK